MSRSPANALAFALGWHMGQLRKGTDIPYISHLLGVASLVLEGGGSLDLHVPAALLHDVVEDTEATVDDVRVSFGPDIAAIVEECSDKDDPADPPPWVERKRRYVEHLLHVSSDALLVSLADEVHNCSAVVEDYQAAGPSLWGPFNQGTAGQLWYYRSLLEVFEKRRSDLEGFWGERHGRDAGGKWLLDRFACQVFEFNRLAEETEGAVIATSSGFDEVTEQTITVTPVDPNDFVPAIPPGAHSRGMTMTVPMPPPAARSVATWATKAREAREKRDEAIRRMSAEGSSLRQIADVAGMSHTGIVKVLKNGGED